MGSAAAVSTTPCFSYHLDGTVSRLVQEYMSGPHTLLKGPQTSISPTLPMPPASREWKLCRCRFEKKPHWPSVGLGKLASFTVG